MRIRLRTVLLAAFVLLAVAVILPPNVSSQVTKEFAQNGLVKSFTVVVSRHGFNGTNNPLIIDIVEGDVVHITFLYGDNDLSYDNPHVIFLQGYDLRTRVISRANPSATLDFIATETGTYAFYCVVPCAGMPNLELGQVAVGRRPAGALPTNIDVMVDGTAVQGQAVSIMATLRQGSQPVPSIGLDFYANTTFGLMKIGSGVTDQNGTARISYKFVPSGMSTITVEFAGSDYLAASSNRVSFFVEPRGEVPVLVSISPGVSGESISGLPYVRGQNRMPDLRLVGTPFWQGVPLITLILLIVGSVWAMYGYVFAQIRAILRGSSSEGIEEKGGVRKLEGTTTSARKGFDKRILVGIVLVGVVLAGVFAYYQFGTLAQPKTETIRIDIKMLMAGDQERHVFDPATITVHKGDHIVLIVTNTDDDFTHGVIIPELNLNTGPLTPGKSATIEFDANTAGTFTVLCPVPGCAPDHGQMIGQLVVT